MADTLLEKNDSLESLTGQFILCRNKSIIPRTWNVQDHGSWLLGAHSKLPVSRLRSAKDEFMGWILGHPIDANGKLADGKIILSVTTDADSDSIEKEIYGHGNRYLVILFSKRYRRIYLDPFGLLSAVYSSSNEIVASSPNLIPYNEFTGDRNELARDLRIPYRDAMYPLELTPRFGVDRILPNHFLNLDAWATVRHWPIPKQEIVFTKENAIEKITSTMSRQISGIVSAGPSLLYLTAGADSRTILACARDFLNELVCCTIEIPDYSAKLDCAVARYICKKVGIQHRILRRVPPQKVDLDRWVFLTGRCVGEIRGWQAISTYKQLDGSHSEILGVEGGLARKVDWESPDTVSDSISAAQLIGYCLAPVNNITRGQVQRWLDTVPYKDVYRILELFTIEQRLGCWAGVIAYGETEHSTFQGFPFCHRDIIDAMCSLPAEYRRRGLLSRNIINRQWPELLEFPFNTPFGLMRFQPWALNRRIRKTARKFRNRISEIS